LEADLFYKGNRPAINAGLSVSRVGSSAQIKAMKKVAGKIRLEAAQFRELAAFSQFGSDLDDDTKAKLERGKRLIEIFKQDQYEPLDVAKQVIIFFALSNGYLDNVPVDRVASFEAELYNYLDSQQEAILKEINKAKELSDDLTVKLKTALDNYKSTLDYLIV
jgi:F-type H+-transporting ATPase subunit alpha